MASRTEACPRSRSAIATALAVLIASSNAVAEETSETVDLGGYVELYGHYNLRRPSNGVTNLRGFDVRHASMALQNAVLDMTWTRGAISGRIAFQVGDAGNIYYAAEPMIPPSGTASGSEPTTWRHVQEARVAWQTPWRVLVAGGLFLSPIGPESIAVRDDWNWSRSNLFFALPFYHLGARASVPLADSGWTVTAALYNGWNNTIDANRAPAISVAAGYAKDAWLAQVLYFGGIERPAMSAEGDPWRHLLDAYVQARFRRTSLMAHVDAGLERGKLGTSSWIAAATYIKQDVSHCVHVSVRGDVVREGRGTRGGVEAAPILLPVRWLASATATVGYRPVDGLDVRIEYRHDHADAPAYFSGSVPVDPATGSAVPTRRVQDTVTAGIVAWF